MSKADKIPTIGEKLFAIIGLFCFSGAVQRLFLVGTGDITDASVGNPAFQVLWFSIYGLTLVLLVFRTRMLPSIISFNPLVLVFIIYLAGSVLWSQAPDITLRRTAGVWGPTLFAFYLISRFELLTLLKLTSLALGLAAIGSLLYGVIQPDQGIMHDASPELQGAWCGLFTHKNSLGQIMLGSCMINLALWQWTKDKLSLIGLGLAIFLIVLSRSTTALILLAITFILPFLYWFRNSSAKVQYAFYVGVFLLISLLAANGSFIEELMVELTGKNLTFTGRVDLWNMALERIKMKPLTGYGYGAFWLGEMGESGKINAALDLYYDTAHNGYLDLTLDLGVIGFFLFFAVFLTHFLTFFNNYFILRKEEYFWGFTFLFIQLVYNFFEGNFVKPNYIYWILYLFTITSYQLSFVKVERSFASV